VAAPRNRKHILVPDPPTAEGYKPHGRKIDVTKAAPPASRAKHGKALERALKAAVVKAVDNGARHSFGTYYGRLHGYRGAAELMGHVGTMTIFEQHYKGDASKADAEQYFEIMPTPAKASKVIKFKVAK